jgi:hypothetical protein
MPKKIKTELTLPNPFACKLIIGLGFLFVIVGIAFAIRTQLFIQHSASVQGKVVRLVDQQDENGHTLYAPEFDYSVNGRDYAITSSNYSRPAAFSPGEVVEVLYDRNNPQNGRISTYWEIHGMEDSFILAGLFFAGLGYAALKYQRRRAK